MVVIHWCYIKFISSDAYMLMHLNLYVQLIGCYLVHMAYLDLSYISLENILSYERVLLLIIRTGVYYVQNSYLKLVMIL